jgi:hypothetical protein
VFCEYWCLFLYLSTRSTKWQRFILTYLHCVFLATTPYSDLPRCDNTRRWTFALTSSSQWALFSFLVQSKEGCVASIYIYIYIYIYIDREEQKQVLVVPRLPLQSLFFSFSLWVAVLLFCTLVVTHDSTLILHSGGSKSEGLSWPSVFHQGT